MHQFQISIQNHFYPFIKIVKKKVKSDYLPCSSNLKTSLVRSKLSVSVQCKIVIKNCHRKKKQNSHLESNKYKLKMKIN
ncbi:hypothetical protein BpHYR1_050458 [Brachionus plicatilis]|uniref:Uncharacterized protein n=1 Tax=Brachionus plicatilis TaxID=10195 RepID=A0A3M7QA58_BRAPC|nr:hypothetical protein BpHYR1_050458 [Brachionus plicatilis]